MSTMPGALGIDAGATLCKVAWWEAQLETRHFPAGPDALTGLRELARERRPQRIVATGGGAATLAREFTDMDVQIVSEFAAWAQGAPVLAALQGIDLPPRYLLVSIGTGTSILVLEGDNFRRIGGTALGGGSLLGLGRLLLGVQTFEQIAALAQRGDRRRVDLLVGDIYGENSPLPVELNAASFAKLESRQPEDLAHALMGLIGENIGLICSELARLNEVETIVYGGSTLAENPALQTVLRDRGENAGKRPVFLQRGGFCGAVGAIVKHRPSAAVPVKPPAAVARANHG